MGHETPKIIVVDDDMRLRALLERYLVEQGFVVRSAANAEQMDRLLERENFHLLVLDLMLPGEDGLSICRRLRQHGNDIPIVMLTAKGDEVDRIIGLELGADDYRGGDGPLNVSRGTSGHILHEAWIEAGRQAGYGITDDMNGYRQEGVGYMDMTVHKGRRWNTSSAYLRPALDRYYHASRVLNMAHAVNTTHDNITK